MNEKPDLSLADRALEEAPHDKESVKIALALRADRLIPELRMLFGYAAKRAAQVKALITQCEYCAAMEKQFASNVMLSKIDKAWIKDFFPPIEPIDADDLGAAAGEINSYVAQILHLKNSALAMPLCPSPRVVQTVDPGVSTYGREDIIREQLKRYALGIDDIGFYTNIHVTEQEVIGSIETDERYWNYANPVIEKIKESIQVRKILIEKAKPALVALQAEIDRYRQARDSVLNAISSL